MTCRGLAAAMSIIALYSWGGLGAAEAMRAEPFRPTAPITAVTAYPDRALVTRTARVDLPAGTSEVVLEGLPGALVDDSVRATGRGSMPVKVTGVDVSLEHLAKPDDARVRALEAEIRALRDLDRGLEDEIRAVQNLQRYLATVQARSLEPPKEPQTYRIDVEGIRGIFTFLSEGFAGLARRQRDAEAARREPQERITKLERDLALLRAPAARQRKGIAVGLEAAGPGAFELQVTYMVPGAAWTPVYEARALLETREVELTYGARVTQQTGEAWEAVALALSTARPAVGARAPRLDPLVVRFLMPQQAAGPKAADRVSGLAGQQRQQVPRASQPPSAADERDKDRKALNDEEALVATADVVATGPSVLFKIARPAHIPNDSRQHKTAVAVNRLVGEFSYLAVPKRSPFAYLVARVTAPEDAPLLAGPVEVFMGPDYIGRSGLDSIAPGQPFHIHLGVDEGIKVRRAEVLRERGEGGFFGKTQRTRFAYEITVENFKRTAETITVQDQIPVAQDQEIEVDGVRFSEEPTEKTERGLLKWTFKLAPREKKVIRLEFAVSHPPDKLITSL